MRPGPRWTGPGPRSSSRRPARRAALAPNGWPSWAEVDVGDHRVGDARLREELWVGVDERHPQRLLVEVEVLLPEAVREAHVAVVSGLDDERAVQEVLGLECVEHLHQVVVGRLDEVAVEVQVGAHLLLLDDRPATDLEHPLELELGVGLGREVLVPGQGRLDVAQQPRGAVAGGIEGARVEEDVVRVDERDDEEERLLLRVGAAEELEHALGARRQVPDRGHVPEVVVDDSAAGLVEVLIGPGIGRVPARPAVLADVLRDPVLAAGRRLDAVELALVHRVDASGLHHRGQVGQVERQLDLRVLRRGRLRLERVLDPVLGREEAGHPRRARG